MRDVGLEVDEVLDRYRTDDRWWTAEPVSCTYYELLLEDGRAVTVFRDEIGESWWEQRFYGVSGSRSWLLRPRSVRVEIDEHA